MNPGHVSGYPHRGGSHKYANAQAAHPSCNVRKGVQVQAGQLLGTMILDHLNERQAA